MYWSANREQWIWIEFVIVPSETAHIQSRLALYRMDLDAIIVVCDATQPRLWSRVYMWADEALKAIADDRPMLLSNSQGERVSNSIDINHSQEPSSSSTLFASPVVPVLLVVNRDESSISKKASQNPSTTTTTGLATGSFIATYQAYCIHIVSKPILIITSPIYVFIKYSIFILLNSPYPLNRYHQ